MSPIFDTHSADLAQLERRDRLRKLAPRMGIDFASNDYLGLAGSGLLADAARAALDRGVPIGSGGSRLLRGNHPEHEALEAEAAAFFGAESALFFATGFAANSALLATMPQRDDLILADTLIHASMHEGLRLTRAAHQFFPHNNLDAAENALKTWRNAGHKGQIWLAVESLYSMDGDMAPLAGLAQIAAQYQAIMIVDEAHATGIFGLDGRGLVADLASRENIITLHTCGKGLGAEGALLCGPKIMREFLVNRARGLIFSTAPSPVMAAVVRASLQITAGADNLRQQLQAHIALAERLLSPLGVICNGTPIMPLILGEDARAVAVAAHCQAAGFDVRAIRPPTVPEGTARLRIVISLNVDENDIRALADVLTKALK